MRAIKFFSWSAVALIASSMLVSGCAVNFYKQSPRSKQEISKLKAKITDLEAERENENRQFEAIKKQLEARLSGQISDRDVSLEIGDRGLVIILSDNILFDSGKADVKSMAYPVLDEVAMVVNEKVPGKEIGVGGHTDNVPITHSKWKSNWELSTARATNVLHYLVSKGVSPEKLSATGYAEHKSVASNDTAKGRSANRRVEIVILPEFTEKRETLSEVVK